jgi:FMN phosphatase YigB (HAD superfamily)
MSDTNDVYIRDANTIFAALGKDLKNEEFVNMAMEEQLKIYQERYPDFARTFPIVMRYMIQFRQYKTKAMARFLKRLNSNPYRSEAEYCERQADYVKYLYMESTPHYTAKVAGEVHRDVLEALLEELKDYKEMVEVVKQKSKEGELQNAEERRNELKNLLENLHIG